MAPNLPAESYLEIFETTLLNRHRLAKRAFLTTSPEMFLKKLLVAGSGNCFTITKSFRNTEDLSDIHNPEFTILEWYRVEADYNDLMRETEELLVHIWQKLFPQQKNLGLKYQGQKIDLTLPWERLSMAEAFSRYTQVDLTTILDEQSLRHLAAKRGYQVTPTSAWEELFNQIYLNEVVPRFSKNRPTIIYDYPVQLAALAAKKKPSDPRFVERFEVYIAGLELADCCSELTDWQEQEKRFQQEVKTRQRLRKTAYPHDEEFIEALKLGLPKCAGIALGVDRLVMLFANAARIQDVLFFPAEEMW